MKKVAILMIITVFALTGVATAKGPGRGGHTDGTRGDGQKSVPGTFWERKRVAEALSLTEEEKAKLTELHNAHQSGVQDMREDLREQRQSMKERMESQDFSSSNAKKHFKRAEKVRSRIQEARFDLQIQQRELLGQERFAKLRMMEKRAMERRRNRQKSGEMGIPDSGSVIPN